MLDAKKVLLLLTETKDVDAAISDLKKLVRDEMVNDFESSLISDAKDSLEKIKSEKISNYMAYKYKHGELPGINLIQKSSIPGGSVLVPDEAKLRPGYEDLANKQAVKIVDTILSDFESKVLSKLEKISDNAGSPEVDILSYHYSRGAFEANLKFKFRTAEFKVKTQIVTVWNSSGTVFNRFPLTFHDVILSNGTKMKSPSEKKMISDFN